MKKLSLDKRINSAQSIITELYLDDFVSTTYFVTNVKKKISKKCDLADDSKIEEILVKLYSCITAKTEYLKRFNEGVLEFCFIRKIQVSQRANLKLLMEIIYAIFA